MAKLNVLIVGGGFGGIKAALDLADDPRFMVTLLSNHTNMWVYGALFHTATGGTRRISSVPLSNIFAGKRVQVLHDKAVKLDRKSKILTTKVGHTLHYDALILGLGMITNYFGIEGLKEYSFGIKSLSEAEELKAHIHKQMIDMGRQDINYVVVGGGPTGVELAGALPAYVRSVAKQHGLPKRKVHVDLVEAAPRLLPRLPKDVSRAVQKHLRKLGIKIYLKTAVQAQTVDSLTINNKPLSSHTVIWTAGMTNNPFFSDQEFQLSKTGKVRVDQFLQSEPGIYIVGDNADTPYSGMAQTALYDGKFVAKNLKRLADEQEPLPYIAKKPVYVMPAGPRYAAVLWGKVRLYGLAGWILRRLADLIAYHDYEPWKMALSRFMADDDRQEWCTMCQDEVITQNYLSGEV